MAGRPGFRIEAVDRRVVNVLGLSKKKYCKPLSSLFMGSLSHSVQVSLPDPDAISLKFMCEKA